MRNLIRTLRNIFRIPELRKRIVFTITLLAVFRLGSYVTLPGIDAVRLEQEFTSSQGGGLLGLLDVFVGGAFSRGSLFALGIMPYITASIILQLLGAALPWIQKLQKEGESGQRTLNFYTRVLTVGITLFQGIAYVTNMRVQFPGAITDANPVTFHLTTMLVLTAGTMFLVWMGDRITENGIGNGTSLIIAIGILAELPVALYNEAVGNSTMIFYLELLALGLVTTVVILLTQGTRKITINYARAMTGGRNMGGMVQRAREHIPLKLNSAGVMPIIFAQSLMFLPAQLVQFNPESTFLIWIAQSFGDYTSIGYNLVFTFLIVVFTYFYTSFALNPNDIADHLKRNGAFIPGVKPGKKTSEYIDEVITRITLPGALFLAFVAILPAIVQSMGVSAQFAVFFGGTSLLIMIGVVLDTLQQIESYLLVRHYDGLMKTGRSRAPMRVGAPV